MDSQSDPVLFSATRDPAGVAAMGRPATRPRAAALPTLARACDRSGWPRPTAASLDKGLPLSGAASSKRPERRGALRQGQQAAALAEARVGGLGENECVWSCVGGCWEDERRLKAPDMLREGGTLASELFACDWKAARHLGGATRHCQRKGLRSKARRGDLKISNKRNSKVYMIFC